MNQLLCFSTNTDHLFFAEKKHGRKNKLSGLLFQFILDKSWWVFKDSGDAGGDAFIDGGFQKWHMKSRIRNHVGAIDSLHNEAEEK
jgi:hypothetical protein